MLAELQQHPSVDTDEAWRAVLARDRAYDGRFVTGVLTTGIYCRPSCAARHPKRDNVRFFTTPAEALGAGLRPCLRCLPNDVTREAEAMEKALRMLDQAEGPLSLEQIAAGVGYSPFHFHRCSSAPPALRRPRSRGRSAPAARRRRSQAAAASLTPSTTRAIRVLPASTPTPQPGSA
jgi:AraC family transcriptional regulator of adaptative response/methylated-DNA-[protein]-cysteine methyltransferase